MKVLLCERSVVGHRAKYMEWLAKTSDIEFYCFAPLNFGVKEDCFELFESVDKLKDFSSYIRWVKKIKKIIKEKNIDIIHILDGDAIMRFMGVGFSGFKDVKVVVTYHHFFSGILRRISYKRISGQLNSTIVVHTETVQSCFIELGLINTKICGYPAFDFCRVADSVTLDSKHFWNLPVNMPTIGIIGGICSYKNILEFLNVLNGCKAEFHLLICGKLADITEEEIRQGISVYKEKVTLKLEKLSEKEYERAIAASDIIYSLYGYSFDGASGPLTDGVCARKLIFSCSHGSLGNIVKKYHLGYTADCNDEKEILNNLVIALNKCKNFEYDEVANNYRDKLKPEYFQNRYKQIYLNL